MYNNKESIISENCLVYERNEKFIVGSEVGLCLFMTLLESNQFIETIIIDRHSKLLLVN